MDLPCVRAWLGGAEPGADVLQGQALMSTGRNTSTRDQHRAVIRRTKPPCAICGQDIDYSLHYLDPMAFVVDHIVPLAKGGEDTILNKQAAHRSCNRTKSDKTDEDIKTPRTFVTTRTW